MKRLFLLITLTLFLGSCQDSADQTVRRTRLLMGTVVEIVAFGPETETDEAVDRAFVEMSRIEGLMSPHLEQSDLSRLSRAEQSAELSPETVSLLERSLELHRLSAGAFDPTLGRVKQVWGIEGEEPRIPESQELKTLLLQTGPEHLSISGDRVSKTVPGLAVDLGGIAKGYAVDRAVEVLKEAGIRQASVNAGGDLRLLGDRQGRPWRIGIQHPRRQGELLAVLSLTDRAVVTSGDYERYFERDGIRYHHIFDPESGAPSQASRSVTVVAADATTADALATAAFILGPSEGLKLLERQQAEGILVGPDGQVKTSEGLKGRIEWR